MLDKVQFKNNSNVTIDLHTDQISITDFNPVVTQRPGESRPRMQEHGEWPTRTYRGGMSIDIEGDLLAESASDYFDLRQSILNVLFPDPTAIVVFRRDGFLRVRFTGATEDWNTQVRVDAFTAPRTVENGGQIGIA